jgi:hypothetical protein
MDQITVLVISGVIAAVTSGVVTLGIEWAAKPSLDARKERILARHKSDAAIRSQLLKIREYSIRLSKVPRMSGLNVEQRAVLRDEWKGTAERLEASARLLDGAMPDLYSERSSQIYELLTSYLGLIYGTLGTADSWVHKGKRIAIPTQAVYEVLGVPRWRVRRRNKRLRIATDLVRPLTEGELDDLLPD